jgi:hypothetical protein
MDLASKNGHVEVLDWWLKRGYRLRYSTSSMDWASENGQMDVIDWWRQSSLKAQVN